MTAASLHIVDTAPATTEEALAHVKKLAHHEIKAGALAKSWGWSRTTVRRRLADWREAGLIAAPEITQQTGQGAHVYAPSEALSLPKSVPTPVTVLEAAPVFVVPPETFGVSLPRKVMAIVLGLTALGLGVVGLTLNARFAASFGKSVDAGLLLAAVGLALDVLTIILPTIAGLLFETRHRLAAAGAWVIWIVALCMTLIAACGFSATNIGDTVSDRDKIAAENAALATRLDRLRGERRTILEARSIVAIETAIQTAQPAAQAAWKATKGCTDVTLPDSLKICSSVLQQREALGQAERRNVLDVDIAAAEKRLAELPAVSVGDPGATMAVDLLRWLSNGFATVSIADVQRIRILGLTITPAMGGLLLLLAMLLWRPGRPEKPAN